MQNKGETVAGVQAIRTGEKDLMDSITADLDWGILQEMIRQRHHLEITDDLEFSGGDIVVHENQVAYRLNFEVKVVLSVLLDREGHCLVVRTPAETHLDIEIPEFKALGEMALDQATDGAETASEPEEPATPESAQEMADNEDDPLAGLPDVSEMSLDALEDNSELVKTTADDDPFEGLPDVSEMSLDALEDNSESVKTAADDDPFEGLPDVSEMSLDALEDAGSPEETLADDDPLAGLPDVSEMSLDALDVISVDEIGHGMA
ncbi:MAG: hypothetical protein JEZ02_05120 [Desulfatibacillum sp.]|nr:hypothetical protein [Desulfatibacillum sp.]